MGFRRFYYGGILIQLESTCLLIKGNTRSLDYLAHPCWDLRTRAGGGVYRLLSSCPDISHCF